MSSQRPLPLQALQVSGFLIPKFNNFIEGFSFYSRAASEGVTRYNVVRAEPPPIKVAWLQPTLGTHG
jgi:hypothetical protein